MGFQVPGTPPRFGDWDLDDWAVLGIAKLGGGWYFYLGTSDLTGVRLEPPTKGPRLPPPRTATLHEEEVRDQQGGASGSNGSPKSNGKRRGDRCVSRRWYVRLPEEFAVWAARIDECHLPHVGDERNVRNKKGPPPHPTHSATSPRPP